MHAVVSKPNMLKSLPVSVQLEKCHDRADMEYAIVVCKRTALDNFPALISASPAFRQAITAVTKGTFEKLVLKAEGFITSGVEGTYSFECTAVIPLRDLCTCGTVGALAASGAEGKKKAYKSEIVNTIRDLFSE